MSAQFRIAVGLGCDRGTSLATLQQALNDALALAKAGLADIAAVASIDLKADESGLLALADVHGWRVSFYSPQELASVSVPNPSETVRKYTGSPSVSEAAALLAGAHSTQNMRALPMTSLLVEKFKYSGIDGRNATVSIARCDNFSFS